MFVGTGGRGVMQVRFNPAPICALQMACSWNLRGDVGTPLKMFRHNGNGHGCAFGPNRDLQAAELMNQRMRLDVDSYSRYQVHLSRHLADHNRKGACHYST